MNSSARPSASADVRLSVDAARARLLAAIAPLPAAESVATRAALGRVLAKPVTASFDVPGEDNAAMAGYAVRAADTHSGGHLSVVGSARSGRPFSGVVGPGQAVRVATGAPLPRGADAIVRAEAVHSWSEDDRELLTVHKHAAPGEHIRRTGENLAQGRPALPAGKRVGPAELGLLAALGIAEVSVVRRPRVALLSVGDELCPVGRPLGPGEVYDSNRYTLYGALTELGADVLDLGALRPDKAALEHALREAAACCDVIITSGLALEGVDGAPGEVRRLLETLGQIDCWKLDLKPGRPIAFGRVGNAWLFGLPANPVAVMVSFYQFVIDGLLRLSGVDPIPVRPIFRVPCTDAVAGEPGRREYRRGMLYVEGGEWRVRLAGRPGSSVLRSMSEANCFIVLDEAQGQVSPGDLVAVQMFEGLF